MPVGVFGLGLLGWVSLGRRRSARARRKSAGQASQVRTAFLEMELDHDSGAMRGRVLAGRHARRRRSMRSTAPALLDLFDEIDGDSRDLLAAYLDRREPGWREHAQGDAGAGSGARAAERRQND